MMSLKTKDLQAIADALQSFVVKREPDVSVPAAVSAVSLKLPAFWINKPEIWFKQIEAQFNTCVPAITNDRTKFDYVVSTLDSTTAGEVEAIILNPPNTDAYTVLKDALIRAFGKSQEQKDMELLNLSGLGDKKPSAMLRHIRSLNLDPSTLLRAVFVNQLPLNIRTILAV